MRPHVHSQGAGLFTLKPTLDILTVDVVAHVVEDPLYEFLVGFQSTRVLESSFTALTLEQFISVVPMLLMRYQMAGLFTRKPTLNPFDVDVVTQIIGDSVMPVVHVVLQPLR